jgi:protoheme IX farnesyltransferase
MSYLLGKVDVIMFDQSSNFPAFRSSNTFRYLLLAAALTTFLLIVLGIVLRVSELGSSCPGWPTCYGVWTPPVGSSAMVPYLHRLVAVVSGVLLLVATAFAGLRYRRVAWIWRPLSMALIVLGVQVLLGWLEVIYGGANPAAIPLDPALEPAFTALHLGLALVIQALVILAGVAAFYGSHFPERPMGLAFSSPFARLSLWTLAATFALLVSGTFIGASGAAAACPGWPLCGGWQLPADLLGWINVSHRLMAALAGALVTMTLVQAWRSQRSQTAILVSTTAVAVLFFSQALMGAYEAVRNYPAYLVGLHVATAAGVWAALIVQVTLTGLARRSDAEERLEASLARNRTGLLKDFLALTKPVVVALLLVTTFAGMVVGGEAWPPLGLVFWTLLAGFMAAGGSGAINQYIDRYDDFKMQRTARRPIPSGRLTPGEGLAFGVALTLASFYLMVATVNFLAALLTLAGIIYYVLLYSILLKKTTVQNIVIGGGAGAIPPLVGWAAATGHLNIPSLFLFAVIFMWTPPHFWALALVRQRDYARAGVPMLPVVRGERETRWQIFLYTVELVALTLLLPLFGLGGGIYLVAAAVLGAGLLYSAWRVWKGSGNKVAWTMYRHSSMYLAFLFAALMIDALL